MKAAQYNSYGTPDVIEVVTEVEQPTPQKGQVLVEVQAASLNPFDYKVRRGYMKDMIPLTLPVTIGGDFSGIVTEVGDDVSGFKVGDVVFGQANVVGGGSGSLAEFTVAKAGSIAKKSEKIDFQKAAALPLVGVSVLQALIEHAQLKKEQKILIHGGSGGIGSIAVQLAKHIGAYVATTTSTKHVDFVKELGADEVIDYTSQDFSTLLKDFDVVYDTVGGETYTKSFSVLKKGGVIVTMAAQPDPELDKSHEVTTIGQMTQVTTARLEELSQLVDSGVIEVQIEKVFSLDEARLAYEYLETAHPKGKVVVAVR